MPDTQISEAPAIFRGMLRDIVACRDYAEVCRMLNLVPASTEVDLIEHHKSHARIRGLDPVADEALTHAEIAAEVLYRLTHMHDHDQDDDGSERAMFRVVSRTTVAMVLGHLIEQGLLEVAE